MNGTGPGDDLKDRSILIVEDEVIIAMALEDSLRDFGYTIAGRATNGADAIRLAIETSPDLALVDIRLDGEMDGIEAANRICRRLDIPVIFLTAYSDDTTLSRAIKTNPFGYLIKPIRPRELYTSIETAVYKHRAIRAETEKLTYLAAVTNKLENPVEQVKNSLEGMVTSIEREEMDLQDVSVILRSQVEELSQVSANLRSLNNSIFRV